jgi:two-component system nitrate/nitrite response regulator NarL
MTITVLLVDDNATFLGIVSRFLQDQPDLTVVGAATGGADGIAKALALRPQVVVLDLVMPQFSGFYVLPRLNEQLPGTAVVVLTLLEGEGYEEAARAAGADGFVAKSRMHADLVPAIREAAETVGGRRRAPAPAAKA